MNYIVQKPFRWKGKNLPRGAQITPQDIQESSRLNCLTNAKLVYPEIPPELYHQLQAAGVKTGRLITIKGEK